MRNLGLILLMGGILAFLYCSSELSKLQPMAGDAGLMDYLRNSAGRLELGRYAAAGAAAVGALLTLFPRARA
jgi:hypothetical protein